ncbi:protein translocase subunit SECA2, chloroplastic-like isoform X2 [Beta vulgaris subsp. vulgaris]|uniref:protein translocase subunit SECA2, chloroplastic-like isoform X2 n=1 Tax=Beta vulgaris subsp. vulgaris TaxID=3555 RepID=UPI00254798C8|nr:protein translocase subunit SECA2, chloroplastic-like isoform X2 [Beta vulgaris subsp. vulgaris]
MKLLSLQINAEKYFFNIRKSLVEFDEVLEVQRKHVYNLRQLFLAGDTESCSQHIFQYMQAVVDEIILGTVDPHKHSCDWKLRKILKEFANVGGKLLNDSFAGITEVVLLESLSQLDTSSPVDFNGLLPLDLPRPPNALRGIRKKTSSFKRWPTICAGDSIT